MLLLLGGGWKQKDKVPQVCMQILKWCIAMHIINGFESLHEFIEARKSCLGPVSVMGSLKALLIWRCRGWLGQRWACLLWYTSWFLDITYLQSDSGCWCVRTLHPADVYGGAGGTEFSLTWLKQSCDVLQSGCLLLLLGWTATFLFVRALVLSCQPWLQLCWNLADSAAGCKLSPPVLLDGKIQGPVTKHTSDYASALQHIGKTKPSLEKSSSC